MDTLEAMRMFVKVADTGSFSRAARASGVGQPAVSKHVAALEERVGAQLLRRGSKPLSLTEAGHAYYESVTRILDDIDETEAQLGQGQLSPSGVVRVAIASGLGADYVIPHLAEFHQRHPRLAVELEVSERHVHLASGGLDVAIRIGRLADSTLLARLIGKLEIVTAAAPEYLERRGTPKTPRALAEHDLIAYMFQGAPHAWEFRNSFSFVPASRTRSNDPEQIRAAVVAGLGIAHNARSLFGKDLAAGRVVTVLDQHTPELYPIHAVTASGRRVPTKTKVFVDFLAKVFAASPILKIR